MKTNKEILEKIKQCVKKNLLKIAVVLVFMIGIQFLVNFVVSFVFVITFNPLFVLILGVFSVFALFFLCYGFSYILGNFYRNKATIIGDLFVGKKDIKRIFLISLCVIGIMFVVLLITMSIMIYKLLQDHGLTMDIDFILLEELALNTSVIGLLVSFGIMIIIGLPFLLLFPVMEKNQSHRLKDALKESRELLKKRVFKLVFLIIRVGFFPIIAYILFFVLGFKVIESDNQFLTSLLSFGQQISLYMFFIITILSINAYYYELTGLDDFVGIEENTENNSDSTKEEECLSLPEV